MVNYTQKIKVLFNEEVTSYQLGKAIGASAQYIDNYRVGDSSIENMRLGKAESLVEFYDAYKTKQVRKIYDSILEARKFGKNLDFVIKYNDAVLANKVTQNINGIFSLDGIIGVYGDIIGGQVDSRDKDGFAGVYRAIQGILDYGKPVERDINDHEAKKFYGDF